MADHRHIPAMAARLGTDSKDLIGWYGVCVCQRGRIDRVVVFRQCMRNSSSGVVNDGNFGDLWLFLRKVQI